MPQYRRCRRASEPRRLFAVAVAVIATASSSACAASAADRPVGTDLSPIRIERCAVLSRSVLQDPFNGLRVEFVSGIAVRFSNSGEAPVTSVSFTFGYEGALRTVVDRGVFAPGVSIDRTFPTFAGMTSGADAADCRVMSAIYADGSTWKPSPKR